MEDKERVEARNVSMYERQWDAVDKYAQSMGLTTSSALRVVVEQWRQFRERMPGPVPICNNCES